MVSGGGGGVKTSKKFWPLQLQKAAGEGAGVALWWVQRNGARNTLCCGQLRSAADPKMTHCSGAALEGCAQQTDRRVQCQWHGNMLPCTCPKNRH